jgi:hypothetical protein
MTQPATTTPVKREKKKKRPKHPLGNEIYELTLTTGKKVKIEFSTENRNILRPVKVVVGQPCVYMEADSKTYFYGELKEPNHRLEKVKNLRDAKGEVVRVPISVPGCTVKITGDFGQLEGRSCCKPPDKFQRRIGKMLALKHLFGQDAKHVLTKTERTEIMWHCVPQTHPWKPKPTAAASVPPTVTGKPTK